MNFNPKCLLLLILPFAFVQCKKDKDNPVPVIQAPNYEDSLKQNLWAYYDFNGNLDDKSGNNHNCVGFNGIKQTYDIWGNENSALDFDGYDDYAVIDSGKNFSAEDFTISFLTMPRGTKGRIFQKADENTGKGASFGIGFDDDNDSHSNQFVFNVSQSDDVCDGFIDLTNSAPLYVSQLLHNDAWYFVTCTFENGTEKVYFNGELVGQQAVAKNPLTSCSNAPFHIGIWWLNDLHAYNGKLDDLRIHTRALSEEEIKYLADCALDHK